MAHMAARRAVKEKLRGLGVRLTTYPYAQIAQQALKYFDEHPELLDQAAELVRTRPQLRVMAEQEERQRLRQWRKAQRRLGASGIRSR
jgi:hypothetical protein